MDLLRDNIGVLYKKYLAAAFGSALVVSIYGLADMAVVGWYHGPAGSAAMGVIAPVWNILYSLGLLSGIGGSVLYSIRRGESGETDKANRYFSASMLMTAGLALLCLVLLWGWEKPMLRLFGADEALLELSVRYLTMVRFFAPSFLLTQTLAAYLRNDAAPELATRAVLVGGAFNIVGDFFCVFTLDMGIMGAGLATSLGSFVTLLCMCSHFLSPKCTLRFSVPRGMLQLWKQIAVNGFSAFFVDVAMGILTMLFNRQIMKWLDTDALAVYAVIVNVSTFVQCCAYGVGQAAQPILSQNYGAGQRGRISLLVRYNLFTLAVLAVFWTAAVMGAPNAFICLFMGPTDAVLNIAPFILRCYALSFPLLLFNVWSTYYFQALMKPGVSFVVSVTRGMVLSGALIMALPKLFGGNAIWLAMPVAEAAVACYAAVQMVRVKKAFAAKGEAGV